MTTPRARISLALGGGGARGYAHIGVIQVLEEHGYEIVGIAGTSMGAMVGALHAAGALDEFTAWVTSLTPTDILRLLDLDLKSPGAIKGNQIMARVSELLEGKRFEDLPIPFTAVATDLLHSREVWFQEGPLDRAIRASISLPGVFSPVVMNGRLLADGGLMNPLPIAPLTGMVADLSVAVNLSGMPENRSQFAPRTRESSEARPRFEWQEKLVRTTSRMLGEGSGKRMAHWLASGRRGSLDDPPGTPETISADGVTQDLLTGSQATLADPSHGEVADDFEALPSELTLVDVMELSYDALETVIVRHRLASYPPDLQITLPKDVCRTVDFTRASEMIALGREYAERALEGIEKTAPELVDGRGQE